jgi:hypothetical protein
MIYDKNKKIFYFAEKYLKNICKENNIDNLNRYLEIPEKKYKSLNDISKQFIFSLQNKSMSPKVINFEKNKSKLMLILKDFNPQNILKEYKSHEKLYSVFLRNFNIKNAQSPKNLWLGYSKSIISVSQFLSAFKNEKDFENFVNIFEYNLYTRAALPMLLEKEIYGLGFALACDALKELGYLQYAKPDVHLKDVFYKLELVSDKEDFSTYKSILKMAETVNKTPYCVDKIFWLICSGNFYLDNTKIKADRDKFIKDYKEAC